MWTEWKNSVIKAWNDSKSDGNLQNTVYITESGKKNVFTVLEDSLLN